MPLLTRHSPANVEAAQLYKDNIKEYERKVKVGQTEFWHDQFLPFSVDVTACEDPWACPPLSARMQ